MGRHIETGELTSAWRALAGDSSSNGWQSIRIAADNPCMILAGRHFPGNEEAIIVGFRHKRALSDAQLPEGKGFLVSKADIQNELDGILWVSLMKQPAGSVDMFAMMATDVIGALHVQTSLHQEGLLQVFLHRIRAWQSFMERASDGVLSSDAEVGLFGELVVFKHLVELGVPTSYVIDAWQGPLDGLHDFAFRTGAIEVKATIAAGRFSATIGTLDQLDDTHSKPLFLSAVRLRLDGEGITLPELITATRETLAPEPATLALFEIRLLQAGYLDLRSEAYTRRFQVAEERLMRVQDDFPRLTRHMVSREIIDAQYQLDVDLTASWEVSVKQAVELLGVI